MAQAMLDKGISIHDIASIIKMNEDKLHNLLGC